MTEDEKKSIKPLADKVFGDPKKADLWMESSIKALGGKKPDDCDVGEVEMILHRIEHGIIS